jgi:hypothetical protein
MPAPASAFPRRGGVTAPASLVRAGFPPDGDAAAAASWLARSLRRLPDELLETPFAGPGEILTAWRLASRTQGALARIGETRSSWTLRDYMHRPRMGAAAILDLLAAREENEARARRAPVSPTPRRARAAAGFDLSDRTEELGAILREHLPARAAELGDLLVTSGLTTSPPAVDDLARAFRDRGLPVPFRLVRRLGGAMLVEPGTLAAAAALLDAAAHLIVHWGICTLDSVVERARSLSAREVSPRVAARVLDALPRLRWLDGSSEWFSFAGASGRAGLAIRKIFDVVEVVPVDELAAALGKRLKVLATTPKAAFEAYLVKVAHCEITDGRVRAGAGFVPAPLDGSERTIVALIRHAGGALTARRLRALAAAAGVKLAALRHFVRTSPLVIAERGRLRLVGVARELRVGTARSDRETVALAA